MSTDATNLRIKLVKSTVNSKQPHRRTIQALGLRRMQHEVVHKATPQIRGMLQSVRHLVQVTEEK